MGLVGLSALVTAALFLRVNWMQVTQTTSFGEPAAVVDGRVVGQTFASHHPGLTAIRVQPSLPWPPDDQLVTLRLFDQETGVLAVEQTLPFGALHEGRFLFSPLDGSAGRLYRLELETQGQVLLVDQHPGNIYLAGQLLQCVRLSVPGGQPFAPEASACAGPNSGTGGDLVFAVDYNGYLGSTLVSLSGQLAAGRSGWAAQPWAYGILAGAYCLALAAFARTLTCRLTTMTTLTPVTSLAATATPRPASTMTDILAPIHKVIVQIPCLNEAETLPVTLAGIPRSIPGVDRVEILVIDDGSTDDTAQVARAHGADYVIRHPERRGLAAAFETGVQACLERGADVIVNTDGDNQYPGDQIPLLLGPILAAQAELVVGDRKPGDNPEFSWLKRLLQRVGSWVVAQAAGAPVPDATSGFRAYTRDAALRLYQFTRYTYTLETLIQANKKGLRVAHVSINTNPVKRPSRLMRSQWEYVKRSAATIVRLYAIYEPLRTFGLLSLPFILVGVGLIGRFLFLYLFGFLAEGVARLVQSVLIGGTSLIVGILVLIFGLLADLIAANRRLSEEALYRLRRLELQSKRYREPN